MTYLLIGAKFFNAAYFELCDKLPSFVKSSQILSRFTAMLVESLDVPS